MSHLFYGRDGSVDYETGWIRNGTWYGRATDLSRGVAGIGEMDRLDAVIERFPATGRRKIREALADPEARPRVVRLLRSSNPSEAVTRQAEADVAEAAHPKGRPIVFKSVARVLGPKVRAVEEAVLAASPAKATEEGETARLILGTSDTARRDLEKFYTAIALDAAGIETEGLPTEVFASDDLFAGIGFLGKPKWLKRIQKGLKKVAKVVKPVAIAAAVVAGAVIAGPAIISAVSTVGGAVIGGVKKIFGGGAPAAPEEKAPDIGPVMEKPGDQPTGKQSETSIWSALTEAAKVAVKWRQAGQEGTAKQQEDEMLKYLLAQGYTQAQAQAMVAQALAAQQAGAPAPAPAAAPTTTVSVTAPGGAPGYAPAPGFPMSAPAAPPSEIPWAPIAAIGAGLFLMMQIGGGRRR